MKSWKFGVLIIVVVLVAFNSLYTVQEGKQAIVTQFGEPVGGAITEAGLKFKIPFIQKVHFFDERILEWDGDPQQIPTADKRYIWIDMFSRWQIEDPLKFYQTVQMEKLAQGRLDDVISGSARDIISSNKLISIVRSTNRKMSYSEDTESEVAVEAVKVDIGRGELEKMIFDLARGEVAKYGIRLIDVKVKRINYVKDVREKVYERMISERQRIAEKYRSLGKGKKAEIEGMKSRELDNIESAAYQKAQSIKGKADATAIAIYAKAYNKDPEFYHFTKSLEAYREVMSDKSELILTTDSELFKYLNGSSLRSGN